MASDHEHADKEMAATPQRSQWSRALLFGAKLIVLGMFLFGCQLAMYEVYGARHIPDPVAVLERHLAEGADIAYLGDSTTRDIAGTDKDTRNLAEMVEARLPNLKIARITYPAYQAEVYQAYCEFMAQSERKPKAVIIPINIRSFSPVWDLRPQWQFEKLNYFLRHRDPVTRAFFRPLSVFRIVKLTPISMEQFMQAPVYEGDRPVGKVGDFEAMRPEADVDAYYKEQFIYCYMERLTKDHRKLVALRRAVAALQAGGIAPVLYFTPVDYQAGEKLLGKPFAEQLAANIGIIKETLDELGVEALDLSRAVDTENFCYRPYTVNEHMDEKGRGFVADKIAERVRQLVR